MDRRTAYALYQMSMAVEEVGRKFSQGQCPMCGARREGYGRQGHKDDCPTTVFKEAWYARAWYASQKED